MICRAKELLEDLFARLQTLVLHSLRQTRVGSPRCTAISCGFCTHGSIEPNRRRSSVDDVFQLHIGSEPACAPDPARKGGAETPIQESHVTPHLDVLAKKRMRSRSLRISPWYRKNHAFASPPVLLLPPPLDDGSPPPQSVKISQCT